MSSLNPQLLFITSRKFLQPLTIVVIIFTDLSQAWYYGESHVQVVVPLFNRYKRYKDLLWRIIRSYEHLWLHLTFFRIFKIFNYWIKCALNLDFFDHTRENILEKLHGSAFVVALNSVNFTYLWDFFVKIYVYA